MARATALLTPSRTTLKRLAGISAALALSGCIGNSSFDDLNAMQPVGSPFAEFLFKDYSYLAKSFGTAADPGGQAFDAESDISLTSADNTISGLANAYAQKALSAGRGDEVLPEPAPDGDADAENVHLEVLRDLDEGRDKAPEDAARAQSDYDCWVMNRRVPSLATAAAACRRNVTASLAKLEGELNPEASTAPPPPPVAETPAPSAAPAPQPVTFTVYFGSRSATLSPDALGTISQTIDAARAGRQSHITVVGHTDTEESSQKLSLRRADTVEAALARLGARTEAIAISGVGADDPAVQTDAHAKEPKNRRVVITLVP